MTRLLQAAAILLLSGFAPADAQATRVASSSAATDAAWAREYVTNGKDIKGDPRFMPLMKASFPQREWFIRDHGNFLSLPNLVMLYIGVPEGVVLDADRYVTAAGCMPHACTTRSMLWIDTEAHPATLIFAAQDFVHSSPKEKSRNTLWLFSSRPLNWQQPPQTFISSLQRWQSGLIENDRKANEAWIDEGGYLVANLVQPNGEILVLTPTVLGLSPTSSGAKQ